MKPLDHSALRRADAELEQVEHRLSGDAGSFSSSMKSSSPKGLLSTVTVANDGASPLTKDDLIAAVKAIEAAPPRAPHVHLVGASAHGWTRCIDCGALVWVQGSSQQTASRGAR